MLLLRMNGRRFFFHVSARHIENPFLKKAVTLGKVISITLILGAVLDVLMEGQRVLGAIVGIGFG
jgi:hypothetical protein